MAGLYLHIPFCKQRCIYCDFYSTTLGQDFRDLYVEALCREIRLRRDYLGEESSLKSVYFGGGTPSLLSVKELERIFTCINEVFTLEDGAEITLEANPDDLTMDYISDLRSLPINRLSMGLQTFNDKFLETLHRRHNSAKGLQAVENCLAGGFENLSIDLMYGLPGQTLEDWSDDLDKALSLNVKHLSAYSLIYEEGTPLWKMRSRGEVSEADEELSLQMFNLLQDRARESGFEHYEISNFAIPGYQAVHNSSYWSGASYLGCGPAAHSYNGMERRWNLPDVKSYVAAIGDVPHGSEMLDNKTRYNETIITGLRTSRGINLDELSEMYGSDEVDYLLRMAQPSLSRGLLRCDGAESGKKGVLRLTREGLFVSDDIMSDLLDVE